MISLFSFIKSSTVDVRKVVNSDDKKTIIYLNPYTYNYFRTRTHLIENVDGVRFDGFFMSTFLKLFGVSVPERQSFDMTSLAPIIFNMAQKKQMRIYLCGGTESDVKSFTSIIQDRFRGINVVGSCSGYFDDEDFDSIKEGIVKNNPDLVILGLGGKKQEIIASKLAPFVDSHIFTCGAFISQTTERISYYPEIIDRYNLRWAYRFWKEPHTIKRVVINYPIFVFNLLIDFFKYRIKKRQ
jgi:N-acetylglucosaminyldiphosphoundecaprenol N-acetyl-beta-D-mannosaminyltransferase